MKDYIYLKGCDVDVAGAPEVIPILPLGHVSSLKGSFLVDEESFRAMKARIAQRGVDLVVDYEHQTLKGCETPAAGWVKELKLEDGQIKAVVDWTERAAQYLKNREYRYLSPVITVRKPDGKATGLHSLALTNTPAIEGMTPIVNSQNFDEGENQMDEMMKELAKLLGLPEGAETEEIMQALKTLAEENKKQKESGEEKKEPPAEPEKMVANKAVCELLGLKAGAPTEDVTAEIMKLKGGNIGGMNVLEELRALKQAGLQRDADDAVLLALKAGKVTPAMKEWATSYALSDPKGFASFVEKSPQVVPLGEIQFEEVKALKNDISDEDTVRVCKLVGVGMDDVKKYGGKK